MIRAFIKGLWPDPVPLQRDPLTPPAPTDLTLVEEATISETDIETALRAIRLHADMRRGRGPAPDRHLDRLLARQQAEKFANDCLEFTRVITRASRIDRAFTIWARAHQFSAVSESDFADAIQGVLAWYGGHRAIRQGKPVYVGCRLKPEIADSLGKPGKIVNSLGKWRPGSAVIIDQSPTD